MENKETDFVDLLTEEHTTLRRALIVLKNMTDRVEHGISTDRHDVNALLIFMHYFGDVLHQAKEESVLFPVLNSSAKFDSFPEIKGVLGEHHDQRALIEKVQFDLFTDKTDEFITSAHKLIDLLSEHIYEEEHILLPFAVQMVGMAKANEITVKFQEADAKFGFRQRKLLMDTLQVLEERYRPKAA